MEEITVTRPVEDLYAMFEAIGRSASAVPVGAIFQVGHLEMRYEEYVFEEPKPGARVKKLGRGGVPERQLVTVKFEKP
jgi:hypothetical protein